jgi:flagella basal body P-ring formation protein FlgA
MMAIRVFLFSAALLGVSTAQTAAQADGDTVAVRLLRANVTVTSDLVRIGDLVDNAGSFARVAIYRAPDLGATGSLPTAQVLSALRAHEVIGVETGNIKEVTVTRLARTVQTKEIELAVAQALEHRGGLGDAANLTLTFSRELQELHLDASNSGPIIATSTHYEPRGGRFDVTFEIANDTGTPTKLRFAGTAIETVEAAVLTRNVERAELLKSGDIVVERRPKSEVGTDPATRDIALGMQMRRPMRTGQPLRVVDLAKPDLVQRDQAVTLIYQTAGMYLTTRGKALDSGTEGDVVSVLNPQSKRTVTGVVTGRGQVTIQVATPQPVYIADTGAAPAPDQPFAPSQPIADVSSQAPKRE